MILKKTVKVITKMVTLNNFSVYHKLKNKYILGLKEIIKNGDKKALQQKEIRQSVRHVVYLFIQQLCHFFTFYRQKLKKVEKNDIFKIILMKVIHRLIL